MPAVEDSIRQALDSAKSGQTEQAMAILRTVLDEAPEQADANWIMGTLLASSGRLPSAIQHLERAVRSAPENPQMIYQLGAFYNAAGQYGPGIQMMQRAVQIAPTWHIALTGLATAMSVTGQPEQAEQLYRRALAASPNNPDSALGLAGLLITSGRPRDAVEVFRSTAAAHPSSLSALGKLASALNYIPDAAPEELLAAHRAWGQLAMAQLPPEAPPTFAQSRDPERRLRIGFLSPDLFDHSVAYFLRPILESRHPARLETIVFSITQRGDAMTEALRSAADRWHDYAGRSEAEIATLIRTEGVDILIELAGHTSGNSLHILRRRCAPIQATYIGYPNTTGLPTIDYRIVDAITDPPESDAINTERLLRLDGCFLCYQPPAHAPAVAPPPCLGETAQKAGAGWDSGWFSDARPVTFGSFNSIRKISPTTVDLWARVLKANPGSRLLLKTRGLGSSYAQRNIGEQFRGAGVDPDRLSVADIVESKPEHWGWYGRVDIALDTTPYNGTTTTCEALWMGVPVVTLRTALHAGRVGASLLTAAGLPQLIATTPDEFVHIATELAADRTGLGSLRDGMRARLRSSTLCDREGHAHRFESALRAVWRQWCAGAPA